jgi:hypothetical protein
MVQEGETMRKALLWIAFLCWLGAAIRFAHSETKTAVARKAGLWEVKATTKIQQDTSQAVTSGQTESSAPSNGDAQGVQTCYTQEMIDTYGILFPPSLRDCQISNALRTANGITAEIACKGWSNGKGSLETTWSDDEHATSVIHFIVMRKRDQTTLSMGWTQEATAVFKSSDCGGVKPRTVPPAK